MLQRNFFVEQTAQCGYFSADSGSAGHLFLYEQADCEKSNRQSTTPKEIKNKEYIKKEVDIKKEKNIKKERFSVPPEIADAFAGFSEMRTKTKKPLTDRAKISAWFENLFGDDSGYFQQYLFYYKRTLEKQSAAK